MLNKKALAASVSAPPAPFVEDVFFTYLYTGNDTSQTINNGIDLSGKGGLVWIKCRNVARNHLLTDTVRGAGNTLFSNLTDASNYDITRVSAFNSNGFNVGASFNVNGLDDTYCSWTFREQAKFFDAVSYTGTGSNTTILHDLGSVPGMIIVKRTDTTGDWQVYHRANTANPETDYLVLNDTAATADSDTRWNDTLPTSTVFSLGTDATVNASGGNYVAYLFAHDAGGFGTSGTDNVISCGSYTGNTTVTLGYEPQWIMIKRTDNTGNWDMHDNMRGWLVSGDAARLRANLSDAESSTAQIFPSATGFTTQTGDGATYIYMAIRRPMKVPTTGTEVFGLNARTGTGANATVTGSAGVSDAVLVKNRGAVASLFSSRLTGTGYLVTSTTAAEVAAGTTILQANPWDVMDGVKVGTTSTITNASANTYINYLFRRASGFMDVVCYTGTGSARTVVHNLTVAPELMIVKRRDTSAPWFVYSQPLGNTKYLLLNSTAAGDIASTIWNDTTPTSSVFTVGAGAAVNGSGGTLVAYLFATCAGVSKVGSYTGNGTTQAIACGFTGGARFVLIKRTDDTGDWYVYDTARGMTVLTNPYLELNTADAESATLGSVTTTTGGFTVDASILAAINTNTASYIFLAIS
jgi:hypothetical protein